MKRIAFAAGLFALLLVFSGCQGRGDAAAFTVEIRGSTSVEPLVEMLADTYRNAKPNVRINISGTGSGDGIRNTGSFSHFGMTCRDLTAVELGLDLQQWLIALDGIAVIVNPSSPVENLTLEQIRGIFTGEIVDWAEVTGGAKTGVITVFSREEGADTRVAFEEVMGFTSRLRAGAIESKTTNEVADGIVANPLAIGYMSIGSVPPSVRAISVDGAAPTVASVLAGTYRIVRPFVLLHSDNLPEESRAFLMWILGPEGQAIVARQWIPVE